MPWEKWTQLFMKSLTTMEGVEATCSTWPISKMIPVPVVCYYTFLVIRTFLLTINTTLVGNICHLFFSMGLFCLGSNLCLVFRGEDGMLSCIEVWCRGGPPCKKLFVYYPFNYLLNCMFILFLATYEVILGFIFTCCLCISIWNVSLFWGVQILMQPEKHSVNTYIWWISGAKYFVGLALMWQSFLLILLASLLLLVAHYGTIEIFLELYDKTWPTWTCSKCNSFHVVKIVGFLFPFRDIGV